MSLRNPTNLPDTGPPEGGRPAVAVIGGGIAGLGAAWSLREHAQVHLFEAEAALGGHARTVDVEVDGRHVAVDTGFLVYNERTYPRLIRLFEELGVETAASDMSFSVQVPGQDLEWSGSSLDTVFAQRRNLMRGEFWLMLRDLLRFNRLAHALALDMAHGRPAPELDLSMGEFLAGHRFSRPFCDWYFLPMVGSIWSCPTDQMLSFPVRTMLRFCHNHGLIQVSGRPPWRTVAGGSRRYVDAMAARLRAAGVALRPATPVRRVRRSSDGVWVSTDAGTRRYDQVVFASHSDQTLALLADPDPRERELLAAVRYQSNLAVLHTDATQLPARRRAWAAWNYERATHETIERSRVCLHYWLNRLQPLGVDTPIIETLNPIRPPQAQRVLATHEFAHPVFDAAAIRAQQQIQLLQGARRTWFCGAWLGYGFHEDGLKSGLAVGERLCSLLHAGGHNPPAETEPLREAA